MALLAPIFQQNNEYSARMVRQLISALSDEGAVGSGLAVSQRSSGPNMSVDVAAGRAFIDGDDSPYQGTYLCVSDSTANLVIQASESVLQRIDLVVARVLDEAAGGPSGTSWQLDVITGTPNNPPAAPATPTSAIPLARVLVPAAATSIVDADITDVRPRAASPSGARFG